MVMFRFLTPLLLLPLATLAQQRYPLPPAQPQSLSAERAAAPRVTSKMQREAYLFAHDFNWVEKENGNQILEESGIRYGLGLGLSWPVQNGPLQFSAKIEGYVGDVDYDGGVFSVDSSGNITTAPLKDTTSYVGGKIEGLLTYRTGRQTGLSLDPYIGLGLHAWKRSLGSEFGYDEYWSVLYVPVGIRLTGPLSRTSAWFLRGEAMLPLVTDEAVRGVPGGGDTDLSPKAQVGFTGEVGILFGAVSVAGFYESYSFDASDPDFFGAFQPSSDAQTIGLRVGYRF